MNIVELLDSSKFQQNWARQSVLPYGGADEPALAIAEGDELRVLVAAPIGIVDLRLSRSGPRSFSRYDSSGRLWGWGDLGPVELRTESHPPQPEFGHEHWWTVAVLTIDQLGLQARSDDEPRVRGLADFALEAVRQRRRTCDRNASTSFARTGPS